MFESLDDFIADSHFRLMAVIDSRELTVMATTEIFKIVNANISSKQPTQLGNLHMIQKNMYECDCFLSVSHVMIK